MPGRILTGLYERKEGSIGPTFKSSGREDTAEKMIKELEPWVGKKFDMAVWPVKNRKSDAHPTHVLEIGPAWAKGSSYGGQMKEHREPERTTPDVEDKEAPF